MKLQLVYYLAILCLWTTSCSTEPTVIEFFGCTNPDACNYDPEASLDNGTCDLITCNRVLGCTDQQACNFNPNANVDDNSCEYISCGCTDPTARNYNPSAVDDNGTCDYRCTKSALIANIFLRDAPVEIGSIKFEIWVDGELAVETHSQQYEKGGTLLYAPENFVFNREGNNELVRFNNTPNGTFSFRVFINDTLTESTDYSACYVVGNNSDTILPSVYFIGGFQCRNQPCDFSAFLWFEEVFL